MQVGEKLALGSMIGTTKVEKRQDFNWTTLEEKEQKHVILFSKVLRPKSDQRSYVGACSLPLWLFWTPVLLANKSVPWQSPRRKNVFIFLSTSARYKVRPNPLVCRMFVAFFKVLPLAVHPKCFHTWCPLPLRLHQNRGKAGSHIQQGGR